MSAAADTKLSRPTNVRWRMVIGLVLPITFVMSMDRTAMTVSAPLIQSHYHFSLFQMSIILTSFTWAYALFQVPGGMLVRRIGARKTLALAGLWWSIFTFLTPYGFVFLGFVVIRILLGMGQAADWPSSVFALKKWFPHKERSRANSFLLAGLYLGSFIGTPVVVWIADSWGWQSSFHIFAFIGAALAVAWFIMVRDDPSQLRSMNHAEVELIREDNDFEALAGVRVGVRAFLGSTQFWAIGIQYIMLGLIQSFFTTWLPTYLVQARGISFASMGFLGALPWGAMILAVFGVGYLNDRIFPKWVSRKWLAVIGFFIAAAALTIGALSPNNTLMIVWMCISLGAVGMVQVEIWAACQDLGGEHAAAVTGFTNMCGNLAAAAGPIFTSLLVGIGGNWGLALTVLATSGALGIVCWFFIHPERPLALRALTLSKGTQPV